MKGALSSFGKPFRYQVTAYRLRLAELKGTAKWDDVWQAQHDRAFMVAGAMKADLLADLAMAVDKAISTGTSLETFRRDFRKIVTERGWHGWTGEGTPRGEAWRTRLIYRTNLATSYAAGRFAQLTEAAFPFWVYFHGNSAEPRLQHLAWDGLILPSDHPFWATHYPPNGWGCSCYVSGARSLAGATRLGGKPDLALPEGWQTPTARTGAPAGIDKGWGYAPGASVADTVASLAKKVEELPERPSIDLIQSWLRSPAFARWFADPTGSWPLARLSEADAALIGSKAQVAVLSAESAKKQLRNHPDLSAADYMQAQAVFDQATHKVVQDARHLIFVQEISGAQGYVMVVKAVLEKDELFIVSLRRLSRDEARADPEIGKLIAKQK